MTTLPSFAACPVVLKLLADYWNLRIIETLHQEAQRFCALQRSLDDVNPATLTKKLSELESAGLVARTEDTAHHVVYTLTPLGLHALPVITAIKRFSAAHADLRPAKRAVPVRKKNSRVST